MTTPLEQPNQGQRDELEAAFYGLQIATPFDIGDGEASIDDVRTVHDVVEPERLEDATGAGTTVVVMDSGIDDSHPVFRSAGTDIEHVDCTNGGRIDDRVGHGTACAGLIAQLAPDADLVSLRIFDGAGRTSGDVIERAYKWLHSNSDRIDVVNMSWGSSGQVDIIDRWHNSLVGRGVHALTAAGNSGNSGKGLGGSPATAKHAFGVGACTEQGRMASFSSYNPDLASQNPDTSAIGRNNILARAMGTRMGSQLSTHWTKASGTSFACPIQAALLAKCLSSDTGRPDLTPPEAEAAFESTSLDIGGTPRDGAGIVQYRAARDHTMPDEQDHTPERNFEDHVVQLMEEEYGASNVDRQHRLSDGRRIDVLVQAPRSDLCIELENDSGSVLNGSGQAAHYATKRCQELLTMGSTTANTIPVLGVPKGHIDSDERATTQLRGVQVYEISVPEDVSLSGV